ncbi:cupin domain-containing protein [Roseibium sp. MMSF_3544]|uniref:cupin domain-containing protein n=1 Tax=unclassified Roseibium TaxID=2629323 RepID=UPI00273E414E|nr:cupin domain-containing protein [Roseibium sp. MMSF_3544]
MALKTTPEDPTALFWHLWADADGVTHQSQCRFGNFELKSFAPPAKDLWTKRLAATPEDITILVLQPGTLKWHRNPKPQWIIPLSGTWFVESMDGTRVEMGPGMASFGEDQLAKPDKNGNVGHLSGVVGEEPCVLMLIQLTDPPRKDAACRID